MITNIFKKQKKRVFIVKTIKVKCEKGVNVKFEITMS